MERFCKHCSMVIYPDIRYEKAQTKGWCTPLCEKLYEAERDYILHREQLRNEHIGG